MSTQNASASSLAESESSGVILGSIVPEPSEREREAIRLALEQIAAELQPPVPLLLQSDSKWRFSGRWWNQDSFRS